jgi:hypothetical protein
LFGVLRMAAFGRRVLNTECRIMAYSVEKLV